MTCSDLGTPSKQLSKSMVNNSPLVNIMLTFCENFNVAPEIIQVVKGEQFLKDIQVAQHLRL